MSCVVVPAGRPRAGGEAATVREVQHAQGARRAYRQLATGQENTVRLSVPPSNPPSLPPSVSTNVQFEYKSCTGSDERSCIADSLMSVVAHVPEYHQLYCFPKDPTLGSSSPPRVRAYKQLQKCQVWPKSNLQTAALVFGICHAVLLTPLYERLPRCFGQ